MFSRSWGNRRGTTSTSNTGTIPLRLPRIVDGADPVRHPVAIVGGSPIGLAPLLMREVGDPARIRTAVETAHAGLASENTARYDGRSEAA